MEVLGAVASTLTLLEVSLKTAGFLHGLSEAQSDFESLQEQIADIRVLVQDFGKLPQLFANTPGLPQISDIASLARASAQLQDVQRELEDVAAHCAQILDGDSARVRKRKWVLQRNRIPKLLAKTRNAKENLQLAMQMQTYTLAAEQIVFQDRQRSEFTLALQSLLVVRDGPPSRTSIGEEGETAVGSNEDAIGFEETVPTTCTVIEIEASYDIPLNEISLDSQRMGQSTLTTSSSTHIVGPNLAIESRQAQKCSCSRRLGRNHYQTPTWLQLVLGSWRVEYAQHPGTAASARSDVCKCGKEITLELDYQFPKWLCARNLIMEAAFGSSGLRFTLRPARCIPFNDSVWSWIKIKTLDPSFYDVRQDLLAYFPSDAAADGCGLIEYAIMVEAYDILEVLLDLWGNILKKQTLPKLTGYMAHSKLGRLGEKGDRERYLLGRVLPYAEDSLEWKTTMVHRAASTGKGMRSALDKEDWAKDELDYREQSPVHIASRRGNCMALEDLIKAGAEINQPGYRGWTPLMVAAISDQVDCVRLLLQAGCNVNQKDRIGCRAIHHAGRNCSLGAMRLLLAAGTSPSAVDDDGRTPLHHLGDVRQKMPNTLRAYDASYRRVCQAADLLLVAKDVILDARDHSGFTPALQAMYQNDVSLLRHLIKAGASLPYVAKSSENFLHIVAGDAKYECLKYLLTVPARIFHNTNVDLCNNNGNTPWDAFVYTTTASTRDLVDARRPSQAEKLAFTQLFKLVRDTNIRLEINSLDSIIQQLRSGSLDDARVQLSSLADQKASPEWKEFELAGWYRGIIQQTRAEQTEVAITALVEYVDELTTKIGTEP